MASDGDMIRVEQAIFTSASSLTGQGYQIVAASAGLSAETRRDIATSSPSHNSMCDPSDDAVGLTFHVLRSSGSSPVLCSIGRTCHAGREQTGRGGQRVLTQTFVLTAEQLALFGGNPFAVLRALGARGAFRVDHRTTGTLDTVTLTPHDDGQWTTLSSAWDDVGDPAMVYLLTQAMTPQRLILSGTSYGPMLIEAVLLAVPSTMRMECSFSIGLNVSLSRPYRLTLSGPLPNQTLRAIRGQNVAVVGGLDPKSLPAHSPGPWQRMTADCRRMNRLDRFCALTRMSFDDTSADALARIAGRQMDLNHLHEASTPALVDTLTAERPEGEGRIERALDAEIRVAARRLLLSRLPYAPQDEVRRLWKHLVLLAEGDDALQQLTASLYDRFGELEPPPPGELHETTSATSANE